MTVPHLFIFGLGYVGTAVALAAQRAGWIVNGTTQSGTSNEEVKRVFPASALGSLFALPFAESSVITSLLKSEVTHVLSTIPPHNNQDPVLALYKNALQKAIQLGWTGYLSTTGVYGDYQGAWVNETSVCHPIEIKSQNRYRIEQEWTQAFNHTCIFRLAGIYGPGRNILSSLKSGKVLHRILKQNHVFCRIHLDDIVDALKASLENSLLPGIYNLADDYPAPQSEVIEEGCRLLEYSYPPKISFEEASLSSQAKAFYQNSRRVSAEKIKKILKLNWKYPSYKEGLQALYLK